MKNVYILLLLVLVATGSLFAQDPMGRLRGIGRMGQGMGQGQDSLRRRDNNEDSITLRFRYLDTSRLQMLDSSVVDFYQRFPVPMDFTTLGNLGTAARSYAFSPRMESGWDHGFHAFDIYRNRLDKVRFFQTTRPYSELGYLLGSRSEQMISVLHTQNIQPNWNFALQYNLINAPGFFKNQNTNHNGYLFNTDYQSRNRRYHLYFIAMSNSLQANENGGIKTDQDYLNNLVTYKERNTIPVQLGDYVQAGASFLNSRLNTGNRQRYSTFFLRQQYDLGKRDSLVTDSSVIQLFYPRFRMEHTVQINRYRFRYFDARPDTPFYVRNYNFLVTPPENFNIEEGWNELVNDFSLYSFPEAKNPQQFLKAGISLQNLSGTFDDGKRNYYNLFLHGEYRNKTRNKKWDLEAHGRFYLAGFNNADFDASGSLKRLLSRKLGTLQVGMQNVNRTPSFIFNNASSFSFGQQPSLNKENITRIFGAIENEAGRWKLAASYYLVSNYTYFYEFYKAAQASALFNVLVLNGQKTFRVGKRWHWMARVQVQQRAGDGPLNMPLFFTHHRLGYEGTLGFKNLRLAAGLEGRYYSAYKADQYSPLLSQYFYQDAETIRMNLPDIAAYVHFRIRAFAAYFRVENINTFRSEDGVLGFTNNNLAAPGYAYPGLQTRLGIFWSFVN